MTVESVVLGSASGSGDVGTVDLKYCERHMTEIQMALTVLGLREEAERTEEERVLAVRSGEPDAVVSTQNRVLTAALTLLGPEALAKHECPACAFEEVISIAADCVVSDRTRKN